MAQKRVKLSASENVIEEYYKALASNNSRNFFQVHIPKSDVFYVRTAIEESTGVRYTLDHVERSMYLEGHLKAYEVLDPERPRGYCSNDIL
jgi:hypothetical protein|tara:strand:+ start:416 stop:688 length:273 start_codon:yes stop_codon:yes gene_type:complete